MSEESSLTDVGIDNPWGDIDVADIPMEIISDPNDTDNDVACSSNEAVVQRFEPLSDFNRKK